MKKFILFGAGALALCVLVAVCITLFGGNLKSGNTSSSSTDITIYNDDNATKFSVKYGSEATVTSFTKSGYYLEGYYTERDGGQKYFDSEGKSTSVWQKGYPNTFYAHWNPLSELKYSDTKSDGKYGQLMVLYAYSTSTFTPEMLNAIKGNLDKKLKFDFSCDARDSSNIHMSQLYITNSTASGRIKYTLDSNINLSTEWKHLNYSKEISAREFTEGKFYIYFVTDQNTMYGEHQFLRDIKISVTFA